MVLDHLCAIYCMVYHYILYTVKLYAVFSLIYCIQYILYETQIFPLIIPHWISGGKREGGGGELLPQRRSRRKVFVNEPYVLWILSYCIAQ